jgi:hypothetical protein
MDDDAVYLLHGQADNIVPKQTRWIASELSRSTLKEMLIRPVLSHLDLDGTKPTAWDDGAGVLFAFVMDASDRS